MFSERNLQGLMDLLFTDGELDTDKVLCLNVLALRPCEHYEPTCTPAPSTTALGRQDRPSRVSTNSKTFRKYKINPDKHEEMSMPVILNQNLKKIVQTVLEALQKSNPQKMTKLYRIARNSDKMKEILHKPKIEQFLSNLARHTLMFSSDSFDYSPPLLSHPINLELENPSESLEDIVSAIQHSILLGNQKCTTSNCGLVCHRSQTSIDETVEYIDSVKTMDPFALRLYREKERIRNERAMHDFELIKAAHLPACCRNEILPERQKRIDRKCCACERDPEKAINMVTSYERDLKNYLSRDSDILNKMINNEFEKLIGLSNDLKQSKQRGSLEPAPEKKVFNAPEPNRRSSYLRKRSKEYVTNHGYTTISYLDNPRRINTLNLAKINYEISAKETEQRVKAFLSQPISGLVKKISKEFLKPYKPLNKTIHP